MPLDSVVVWGTVTQIKSRLKQLKGVRITNYGLDSVDREQPVVELTFDPMKITDLEIFNAINDPEKGFGGLANSVGVSGKERL